MLLGFFVSLLIPETKGITLEELAGEEPTSYDSGRNGSVGAPPRPWWLRFFRGGQPAGFFISRHRRSLSGGGGVVGGRSPRVDIMASPELAARQQRQREEAAAAAKRAKMNGRSRMWKGGGSGGGGVSGGLWRKNKNNNRPVSGESREYTPSSMSSTAGMVPEHAGILPGWGVGWGRVDRGGNPIAMENIRLQDVGSLLR